MASNSWVRRCMLSAFVSGQACTWVWDDWDDRDSKGIWEIYASIFKFNVHLLIRLYIFDMLATFPATMILYRRRPSAVPFCGFLYVVAGEVASIAKTYRRISKCALNMYIDAYISHILLESPPSQSSRIQLQAWVWIPGDLRC